MDGLNPTRILIIDDDAAARSALVEILGTEGYEVAGAGDGFAALATLEAFTPDLVLCDLGMPGMDGITFIKRARERGTSFRIAIMSASYAGRDVAATLGADYVPKPIDVARLLQVVSGGSRGAGA
jgi:CheY-like chemotaxis protein